jgi:hypothetical protein
MNPHANGRQCDRSPSSSNVCQKNWSPTANPLRHSTPPARYGTADRVVGRVKSIRRMGRKLGALDRLAARIDCRNDCPRSAAGQIGPNDSRPLLRVAGIIATAMDINRPGIGPSPETVPWLRSLYALFAASTFALLLLQAHRIGMADERKRSGLCPRCDSELRATPGRCPECGSH